MLLPAERLLELLESEIGILCAQDESDAEVSSIRGALTAVRLLLARERNGRGLVARQFEILSALLDQISQKLGGTGSDISEGLSHVRGIADAFDEAEPLADQEVLWRKAMAQMEVFSSLLSKEPERNENLHSEIIGLLVDWETADLISQLPEGETKRETVPPVNLELLQAYLRDRFSEQGLRVTSFQALAGGFGKLTYLFDVTGQAMNGSFVMRRDFPLALLDNDCHHIHHEYEVIKAVFDRDFPAPDALWLDREHSLIPGGDFIIMNRSPGAAGGTVMAAYGKVSPDLARTLASIVGRLHSLPQIGELAALNETTNQQCWQMSLDECVQNYLQYWKTILTSSAHTSSPSTMSIMDWMLNNIPKTNGSPVLVHGDIGFHNFLFDKGELTTVLDWEFAHVGDPAEDLAMVRNALGDNLDWDAFMASYREAGGRDIPLSRVHFFQIWAHLRNAIATIVSQSVFLDGHSEDMKFVLIPHRYLPHFILVARELMASYRDTL